MFPKARRFSKNLHVIIILRFVKECKQHISHFHYVNSQLIDEQMNYLPATAIESKKKYSFLAIAVVFVSIVLYSNTFNAGFVWDDRGWIVSNPSLREIGNIPSFFTTDFWKTTGNPSGPYYRPIINTFLALEFQMFGQNPKGYHFVNIILHALLSLLFYRVSLRISGSRVISFSSALIFASHPIHTENVAWISGVDYIICSIFILSALLLYITFANNHSTLSLILSLLCFAVALFSKEYAIMLPFVIVSYEWLIQRRKIRLKIFSLYALTALFYFVIRQFVVTSDKTAGLSLYERILTSSVIVVNYLKSFFFPYDLKILYDIHPFDTVGRWEVMLSMSILVGIGFLTVYLYKKERKALFAFLWFCIMLFPATNIVVVLKPEMMSLRYLYIPSMGLALLSGIYIEKLSPRLRIIPLLIIILFSIETFAQNRYWLNEISLYEKMTSDAPASALARNNLGVAYLEAGMPVKAVQEFETAVQLDPTYGFAFFNLGNTYETLNIFDRATFYLQKAIEINPRDSRAYNSLGVIYKKTGRYQEALEEFNRSLAANPQNYEAHYNLANLLFSMGKEDDAIKHYIEFLRLAPAKYNPMKLTIEKMLAEKGIHIK